MPGNMKCGRLRSSNCFVVFFPLLEFSTLRVSPFVADSFLPFLRRPSLVLSFFRQCTQRRVSTYIYTTARVALCSLLFLLLSESYSVFPDFFISPLRPLLRYSPLGYSASSRFSTSLSLLMQRQSIRAIFYMFLRSISYLAPVPFAVFVCKSFHFAHVAL